MQGLDVKKPFGAAVRTWRSSLAISQKQLAGRTGLHRTYICDIERGARNVSLENIEKLACALGISTAALFSSGPFVSRPGTRGLGSGELVDILFVEDNPGDAESALEALKSISNSVQVVPDGQAALDILFWRGHAAHRQAGRRPELVLLDLELSKMDGLEVLRRIKSDPRSATIPVVVLAGTNGDRDIQAAMQLGAAAYIVKPVDIVHLANVTPILCLQWALLKPLPLPAGRSEPAFVNKPHLDQLGQHHVTNQRSQKNGPEKPWQGHQGKHDGQGRVRQPC